MKYQNKDVFIVSAFSQSSKGGNKAGVVLEADHLSKEEKQQIAKYLNLSETAFVSQSKEADFKVEFFTPERQVPLCGHATIATWGLLFEQKVISVGEYKQELTNGIYRVTVLEDGKIIMDQPLPIFGKKFSNQEIVDLLDIPMDFIKINNLSAQLVNTGLNDLLIPIKNRYSLFQIKFNDKKIRNFQITNNLVSLHLFSFDTIDKNATCISRNTDPLDEIYEESATGSASGALSCYLWKNNLISKNKLEQGVYFEQGQKMQQPSRIDCVLDFNSKKQITRVRVGGYTTIMSE